MDDDLAVVFVHGILSSARTWDTMTGIIHADPELADLAVLHFEYPSPAFNFNPLRRIPDYNVVADSLKTFLEVDASRFQRLVLVSHSQGGLIVQRYLARMLSSGRGLELARIRDIVMFACPNSGSELFLVVRRGMFFWRHPQERSLRPINELVSDSLKIVLNQVVYADTLSTNQCPIPIHAYAGDRDNIVKPQSAQGVYPMSGVVPGDHSSLIQPSSASHRSYTALKKHLMDLKGARTVVQSARAATLSKTPPLDDSSDAASSVNQKYSEIPASENSFSPESNGDPSVIVRWNPSARTVDFVTDMQGAFILMKRIADQHKEDDDAGL